MAGFELKALITAKDRLSPKLTELQKKLKKFRKNNAITGRGSLGAAAGLTAGATGSLVAFARQEEAATGLKVAMMEVGGKVSPQFEKINDLALKLGNKLPGTTADFQNMMQMLVRQGIPASNILEGVGKASAYLAVQLKKTPEEAAEFAAKMQDATGTASKDMLTLFDTMQRMAYLGIDDSNMLQFFVKSSSILKMINQDGLKAAQAIAPIGVLLGNAGMAGEESGNAVRKVLQTGLDVKKVNNVNKKLLKPYKIKLDFTDTKGSFGGLDNFFNQLDKLNKLKEKTKQQEVTKSLFGDDSETLTVVNKLLEKGKTGYDEIVRKMQKQADLNRRVEAQLGTQSNLWEALTGTVTNGFASIGSVFEDDTKEAIKGLSNLTEKFDAFVKAHPNVVRSIIGIAAALVTLKLGIIGINLALKVAEITLNTTKIGWLITAMATAAGLVIANWKPVSNFFKSTWKIVKESSLSAWKYIKDLWLNFHLLDWIKEKCDPLIIYFKSLWENIKPYFEPILNGINKIQSWTTPGIDWVASEFDSLRDRMRKALPSISQNPPYTQELNHVGLLDSPLRRAQQGNLHMTVDFRNLPNGAQVKTEGKPPSWFNYDVGYNRFSRQ